MVRLSPADLAHGDQFGFSMALQGDTLSVGVPLGDADGASFNTGTVYLFERDAGGPGAWGQVARITAGDAQFGDSFGRALSLYGDTLAVGATGEDGGLGDPLHDTGAVYIFQRDAGGPGNWGETNQFSADDTQAIDVFGFSVSLHRDTVAVGAIGEDCGPGDPLVNAGAVYLFERDFGGPDNWGQLTKLSAGDAQADDLFSFAVSLGAQTLLVGAASEDGGPGDPLVDAGAA